MDRLVAFALRRVRLLTVIALVAVPWLILRYDIGWTTALWTAGALALVASGAFAVRYAKGRGQRRGP